MTFEAFRARADEMWREIPAPTREGVASLAVEERALPHPDFDGVFTLGECVTDSWPSGFGGDGDARSELVLYHGSFEALAADDRSFDWVGELWETILHELLHHREAAAGESGLDDLDWAEEQNFRRLAGEPFDPDFYRAVPAGPDGVFRLESEMFIESIVSEGDRDAPFTWREKGYTVRVPRQAARAFVEVINLAGGRLSVAVRRTRPWWRILLGAPDGGAVEVRRIALPRPVFGG